MTGSAPRGAAQRLLALSWVHVVVLIQEVTGSEIRSWVVGRCWLGRRQVSRFLLLVQASLLGCRVAILRTRPRPPPFVFVAMLLSADFPSLHSLLALSLNSPVHPPHAHHPDTIQQPSRLAGLRQ